MPLFSSNPIAEHDEAPLAEEGRLEQIVNHWNERKTSRACDDLRPCYVVSVTTSRDAVASAAQLNEMISLVRNQGATVVGKETLPLSLVNAKTFIGKGKALEVTSRARACGASMLVVDADLSPSQTRNLEDLAGIAICDREAIILNVFRRHAHTRSAQIQVELAQLEYLRPRIRGVGLDMDQQTGGMAKARGPGETASELLARKLDGRIEELRKALRKVKTSSRIQRGHRDAAKRIALVGYTNAGKTSLMNALTEEHLSARDMPFETLDTTSRCLTRHGGDVLICDTVGFIRRLPDRLLSSFESTLEEVRQAALIVIVIDASDPERELHLETTHAILKRLGAQDTPRFYVWNKIDRIAIRNLGLLTTGASIALSAHDEKAVATLRQSLIQAVRGDEEELTVSVSYAASDVLGAVYASCRVLESEATTTGLTLRITGPHAALSRVKKAIGGHS